MASKLGRYDVIKPLAKGTLTDLVLGRATGMEGFQRYVAIKILRSEFATQPATFEAFINEARLAAALHHHNIVQVHDIGDDGGRPYFAMEYVHGVDLRTLLAKLARMNQQLPLQHVVSITASAAAALHHAHEQKGVDGSPLNIVHRDVSPGNVLVGFDGNVKVVDFGIAKAAIKQIATDAGVLKGQAPYMSPEQCAGKTVDRRSDVFALGIVLYELATVRRLFKGASDFLTMSAVCNAEVPKPSQYRRDIPQQLEAVMLKALSRDPNLRFSTAGEMSLALDKVASTVGVGASTTALANYMRLQFGDQKEPWIAVKLKKPEAAEEEEDTETTEVTEVDFDGAASGLAPPPSEAVEKNAIPRIIAASASKSSPIVHARTHAMTPPTTGNKSALPPPRTKGTTKPPLRTDETELDVATTTVKRLESDTQVDAMAATELQAVIVRPSVIQEAARPALPLPPRLPSNPDVSATAIVEPLPVKQPTITRPTLHRRSNRILWLVLVAILGAGGAIAAVVFWPTDELAPSAAPAAEPVAKVEAETPPSPTTSEPAKSEPAKSEPAKSAMQMTQADYERERERERQAAAAAAAQGSGDSKPAVAPQAPVETKDAPKPESKAEPKSEAKEAVEPVAKKVAPPKRTTTKTPPKRTVAKTVAKAPAKQAKKTPAKKTTKKPKWNPDDLFLEDK